MSNIYQSGWSDMPMMWGGSEWPLLWGGYDGVTGMPTFVSFFILAIVWSLLWKGLGLWHASRAGKPWWFIAILLINTFGLLEIFYLLIVERKKFRELFSTKQSHKTHE